MPVFAVFGFASQALLMCFFMAHLWRPRDEVWLGRLVYGMGLVSLLLGVAFIAQRQPWHLILAFLLYAAWSALGAFVDIFRPIAWREPPRLSIVIPYATLLTAAVIALWVPLWWVDRLLWIAFGLLYAAHTALNLASHRAARTSR
jgi:hypothetical protein